MYPPMAAINDLVRYTPVVQNARENQKQWSEKLDAVAENGSAHSASLT